MEINPSEMTIKSLLTSSKQFVVPRFQREYSWDKNNYKEFFEDIVSRFSLNNGKLGTTQYFLGTMLFVGNFNDASTKEMFIVDGQQRITTITILFSALSTIFKNLNEEELCKQMFRYIMMKDDDGNDIRVMKSTTHYPYFSYFIQSLDKTNAENAVTEEEENIEEVYNFFVDVLSERKLRNEIEKYFGKNSLKSISYVDIIKTLRDQVLNCKFISITTIDNNNANGIFEILNAKGKKLSEVDLIKNLLFETLNTTEPADFAEDKWKNIKKS